MARAKADTIKGSPLKSCKELRFRRNVNIVGACVKTDGSLALWHDQIKGTT